MQAAARAKRLRARTRNDMQGAGAIPIAEGQKQEFLRPRIPKAAQLFGGQNR